MTHPRSGTSTPHPTGVKEKSKMAVPSRVHARRSALKSKHIVDAQIKVDAQNQMPPSGCRTGRGRIAETSSARFFAFGFVDVATMRLVRAGPSVLIGRDLRARLTPMAASDPVVESTFSEAPSPHAFLAPARKQVAQILRVTTERSELEPTREECPERVARLPEHSLAERSTSSTAAPRRWTRK